jgi:RNA polymerase sigma-70 factor (ECF subfamily)
MPDEAPRDLVIRATRDRAAFAELYDLYLPRIYAFCRKYTGTREDAEDLTAQTFEKALKAIGRYEDTGQPFSAWLLRIAANTVVDHARRTGRVSPARADPDQLQEDSLVAEWEEAYWLHMHIAHLPEDQRQAIYLRFYEDRQIADVGRRLGRSEGAAKQLLRRALRALQLRIANERHEDADHE